MQISIAARYMLAYLLLHSTFRVKGLFDVSVSDCGKPEDWEKLSNKDDAYAVYTRHLINLDWLNLRHLPERAKRVCRLCLDGYVVMNIEHVPASKYPTYIGLVRPANHTFWEWSNGSRVGSAYASEIVERRITNLHSLRDNETYGVVAKRATENWLAEPYGDGEHIDFDNFNAENIICQTKKSEKCYKWNATETCRYSQRYGCYRHTYEMSPLECDSRENRVFASQCPLRACECELTEWSPWSDCNATRCEHGAGVRERTRTFVENCDHYLRYGTKMTQPCTKVVGCEKLKNDDTVEQRVGVANENGTFVIHSDD